MATPRYAAVKVGDRYEFIRSDEGEKTIGGALAAAGGLLALYGLGRGGPFGTIAFATGAGLVYRGVTGHNPLHRLMGHARPRSGRPQDTPSYQHNDEGRAGQLPSDEVDEASMESFPASDPPAHFRNKAPAPSP